MEKESEQISGGRDKEITVQFDEEALNEYGMESEREPDEGLTPRGDIGLPEAAAADQLEAENEDGEKRQTSDMNSPGDSESEDEGVPGGAYAQDERGDGVDELPTWKESSSPEEGVENSERIK